MTAGSSAGLRRGGIVNSKNPAVKNAFGPFPAERWKGVENNVVAGHHNGRELLDPVPKKGAGRISEGCLIYAASAERWKGIGAIAVGMVRLNFMVVSQPPNKAWSYVDPSDMDRHAVYHTTKTEISSIHPFQGDIFRQALH